MSEPIEGDACPDPDCIGILEYEKVENCSCHIAPPCWACENAKLICPICGWKEKE